jgi:FkbM family methyltransferase
MAGALLDSMLRRWLLPEQPSSSASSAGDAATAAKIPFSIIVPTVYGQMILNRNDINQTNALLKTGCAIDHDEIMLLSRVLALLDSHATVIDVGANFGTYTLGLAPTVGPLGKIHAFEPQRIIFNMLAGSIALNSLTNVYCHNVAIGGHKGSIEVPQFDYSMPLNFGSIEFGAEQCEQLTQNRMHDPERVEHVPVVTIDSFSFKRVDLMKIDAEGMELEVLAGAHHTIQRCRPVLYVEFVKVDRLLLREKITSHNYSIHQSGMNYLCIPAGMRLPIQFDPIS